MTADSTWAFALYDCDAEQADELAFRAGDLLHVSSSVGSAKVYKICITDKTDPKTQLTTSVQNKVKGM